VRAAGETSCDWLKSRVGWSSQGRGRLSKSKSKSICIWHLSASLCFSLISPPPLDLCSSPRNHPLEHSTPHIPQPYSLLLSRPSRFLLPTSIRPCSTTSLGSRTYTPATSPASSASIHPSLIALAHLSSQSLQSLIP
jgi:hypothetical protein